MDRVTAGRILIRAVSIEDDAGDSGTETSSNYGYYQRNVGVGKLRAFLDREKILTDKYFAHYGDPQGHYRQVDDALKHLKSESVEWKLEVLYWCRETANADWEFDNAFQNVSKTEKELLVRFASELGVSWNDVPATLSSTATPSNTKSSCFIATAAYGTPFSEEIDVLRNWRDDFLEASYPGRLFIRTYYSLSPPVADNISESDGKRKIVRTALGPIVKVLKDRYSN
jgi:hypothetical protein